MTRYAKLSAVIGFTGALVVGALVSSPPAATDASAAGMCKPGQHQSFSKYKGTVCIPDGGKVGKGVAQIGTGCALGLPAGLNGVLLGCAGGVASVVLDNSYF